MSVLKRQGISPQDARDTATMISVVGQAVASLEYNPAGTDAVLSIARSLAILGQIDRDVVDGIAYIAANLTPQTAAGISDFVNALKFEENSGASAAIDMLVRLGSIDASVSDTILQISENLNGGVGAVIRDFVLSFSGMDDSAAKSAAVVSSVLSALGAIDADTVKSVNKLSDLDVNVGEVLSDFIGSLDLSSIQGFDAQELQTTLGSIQSFVTSVMDMLNKTDIGFKTLFLPVKGRLVGKAMAEFFKQIVASIPREEIEIQISGIAELFQAIYPLIDTEGKYSIYKMLALMNGENGRQIGSFFGDIIKQIPDNKKIADTVASLTGLMRFLSEFGLKDYIKLRVILTEENGRKIGAFFGAVIKDLEEKNYPDLKPVTEFLKGLSSIGLLGVMTLSLLKPILTPKFGRSISGFVRALVRGLDEDSMDRLKGFTAAMKNLSMGVLVLTGSIVGLAAAIEFFGASTVIGTTVIMLAFVGSVVKMLKTVNKEGETIKEGIASFRSMAKVVMLMTLDIYLLAGAAMLMAGIAWEDLGKVLLMMGFISLITVISIGIGNKWRRGGDNAKQAMLGISALLLSASVSIAIVVEVAKNSEPGEVALGIGMIAAVIVGTYFMVTKLLKKANKDYSEALMNVFAIIGIITATGLMLKFIVAPLADIAGEVLIGSGIVLGITTLMTLIIRILSDVKKESLTGASIAMGVMAGVVAAVSLISLSMFPKIAENAREVLSGGIIVLGIIGLMEVLIWGLSKIKESELKAARNTIFSVSLMLGVVSGIAYLLLIPIGENFGSVMKGFAAVGIVIGAMVGMAYLLSKVDEKDLDAANRTILAVTLMVAGISLVSLLLFIPIGARADEVLAGGVIVMGIVLAMTFIAWSLSRLKEDNLKMANITMVVITAIILAVSVVALTLFIPISDQYEDVLTGAAVVLGIVAAMGLMVAGLSLIKKENLEVASASMIIMTLVVAGVALVTKEILIPVGYEAKEALYGAGVVMGIVGIMTAIIWGLSSIKKDSLIQGVVATVAIAAIVALNAYIIEKFVIPVGEEAEAAALGGAVLLGTVAVMGLIVWGLGAIPIEMLALGAAAVAGIGLLLYELAVTMDPYIDLCKKMYENGGDIALGGLELVATIVAWGALLWGLGALSEVLWVAALGAVIIEPIALILWQLGETMPSYIDLCIMLHRNIEEVTLGGLELAATLTAWGVIMTVIGAMSITAAVLSPILALQIHNIESITEMMIPYIDLVKNVHNNRKVLVEGTGLLGRTLEDIGFILGKVGVIFGNPIGAAAMLAGMAAVAEISVSMQSLRLAVISFAAISDTMTKYGLDRKRIGDVRSLFISKGGLADTIRDIVEKMGDVGVFATAKASAIGGFLRPVFGALSDFIRVIVDALNMKYVDEWDERGKPKTYMKVTPPMYKEAGKNISQAFGIFLKELGDGMEALKDVKQSTLLALGFSIRPVIGAVSEFTEAVLSVLTAAIPYEWDENGKPVKFRKFDPDDFSAAALVISTGFGKFLATLGPEMKNLGKESAEIISILGKGIQPLMEAVAKFTDMVIGFINGREMTYTDENGNTVTTITKVDPDKFGLAGTTIANAFKSFVNTIFDEFSKEKYNETYWYKKDETGGKLVQVLKSLENIGQLIDSVNSFIDMVEKSVEKSKQFNVGQKGVVIASAVVRFMNTLVDNMKDKEEVIEATTDAMSALDTLVKKTDKAYTGLVKLLRHRDVEVTFDAIGKVYADLSALVRPDVMEKLSQLDASDISKVIPYLKKLDEATKLLTKIAKIYEKKTEVGESIDLIIGQFGKFENFKKPDVRQVAILPRYLKYIVSTAEEMDKLSGIMTSSDITTAITKFLADIEMLTQADLRERADTSRRSMQLFRNDLRAFTSQVKSTQATVGKFTAKMKKATDQLKKFDDAVIDRERQRNAALKEFGDLIKNIADNMNTLNTEISNLDSNKIMENFKGISGLFNMVLGSRPDGVQNRTPEREGGQENRRIPRPDVQESLRNTNREVVREVPGKNAAQRRQVVNFYFADTTLSGFAEYISTN